MTNDVPLYYRARFIVADKGLYYLIVSTPKEDFAANEAVINQILSSFQPKDAGSQMGPWSKILTVLGGICICMILGTIGTVFFILRVVRKRRV